MHKLKYKEDENTSDDEIFDNESTAPVSIAKKQYKRQNK
jgi:hypothetical protein